MRIVFVGVFAITLLLVIGSLLYLVRRFHRFECVKHFDENNKKLSWFLASVPILLSIVAVLTGMISVIVILVVDMYLTAFWLIGDLLAWSIKKLTKKTPQRYYTGIAVLIFTIVYLIGGWHHAHHVVETRYTVQTNKQMTDKKLRILQITDMHIGATFDGEEFAEHVKKMELCKPDIIVLTGDFVDESSTRKDMEISCKALGDMKSKYGTYFIYGNHDKGNYTSSREFSAEDLEKELAKNNITILEDEIRLIEDFYLIGRKDDSESEREEMSELVEELDTSKFMLVLDHQPTDYEAQKEANVDLVLSGHTHGGHIFPVGAIDKLIKVNCMNYGMMTEEGTTFEVSSGISGWAIPFKTGGAISEYVIIDVERN